MSLSTQQKIWIGLGDAIAGLGVVSAGSSVIHIDGPMEGVAIGALGILLGIVFVLIGLYKFNNSSGTTPPKVYMTISIMFATVGLLTTIAGINDGSKQIAGLGALINTLALTGINLVAFKPDDVKAFEIINIMYTVLGLGLVGLGVVEEKKAEKDSNALLYIIIGALMMALASISSSLIVYTPELL